MAPGIGDGAVDAGCHHYAKHVADYLDPERQKRFYPTPYTFVYAAPGAAAMLEASGVIPHGSQSGAFGKGSNCRTRHIRDKADDVPRLWNVNPELLSACCDLEVSAEEDEGVPRWAQFWWPQAVRETLAAAESYDEFHSAFWREYLPAWSVPSRETARDRLAAAIDGRRQRAPDDDPVIELRPNGAGVCNIGRPVVILSHSVLYIVAAGFSEPFFK